MTPEAYRAFTVALTERLAADGRVLGLVALGSMAAQDYEPDQWSDHDFFVIARDDAAEDMRRDVSWLPGAQRIALAFRETAHGSKVLYDDGHLLELAVFRVDEITVASAGRSRVLLDRLGDLTDRIAAISGSVRPRADSVDLRHEIAMCTCNVLVGVGRHHRGEVLSGHQFVTAHALGHLLRALVTVPAERADLLDGLDPRRRVEVAHPDIGRRLADLLTLPVPAIGSGLLGLADELFGDLLDALGHADVRRALHLVRGTIDSSPPQGHP